MRAPIRDSSGDEVTDSMGNIAVTFLDSSLSDVQLTQLGQEP